MVIRNWITYDPATIDAGDEVGNAIEKMVELRIGALPVTDDGMLVGILTERDVMGIFAGSPDDPLKGAVSAYMTAGPITAQVDDEYNTVYMLMLINSIRHMPVLDGNALVGIVSIRDLLHFYQNKLESELAEARERNDEMKKLIKLSAEDVLESLFSEINKYKELSLTDHLTGLYNKRCFLMRLHEEAARALRHRKTLSLIFCDIDHFKTINDNYGHHHGDVILRQVGEILAGGLGELKVVSRLRKSDIVARYGGEEFVVILPETTAENAATAAEKMRKAVESHAFMIEREKIKVTMSFGVAGLDGRVKDADDLIKNADHAMYDAKELGRNRVEIF
jgi:two-component system, cell cycle response regulator